MSKIMFCPELGCAYRLCPDYDVLQFCPLTEGNIINEDEWYHVEEELVGEEIVTYCGIDMPLSSVYRDLEKKLTKE